MGLKWDQLYKLGTDVAAFMFFHPKRLEHRKSDFINWWDTNPEQEFQSGRLVAFCTGSDGTFTLKFVRRPLTSIEKKVLVTQKSFRYDVLDGCLYWDNSNSLPSAYQSQNADDDPEGWLEIPNGHYRFTVHSLDWYSIPDSEREAEPDISHYLVLVEEVTSLEEVPSPTKVPWLVASKPWHEKLAAQAE